MGSNRIETNYSFGFEPGTGEPELILCYVKRGDLMPRVEIVSEEFTKYYWHHGEIALLLEHKIKASTKGELRKEMKEFRPHFQEGFNYYFDQMALPKTKEKKKTIEAKVMKAYDALMKKQT